MPQKRALANEEWRLLTEKRVDRSTDGFQLESHDLRDILTFHGDAGLLVGHCTMA